jgi:hypothetical protein
MTHPFWTDRINQLEELRRELEINKESDRPTKQINWKELAANYLEHSPFALT